MRKQSRDPTATGIGRARCTVAAVWRAIKAIICRLRRGHIVELARVRLRMPGVFSHRRHAAIVRVTGVILCPGATRWPEAESKDEQRSEQSVHADWHEENIAIYWDICH